MNTIAIIEKASGSFNQTQHLWMPASQTRPFFLKDPCLWWLDLWGKKFGFKKEEMSEYDFLKFIFDKGHKFEEKWKQEVAPRSPQVCNYPWDVKNRSFLEQTFQLMNDREPIIFQPALWWAPEKIHGVPDVLILSTEVEKIFPGLLLDDYKQQSAPNLKFDGPGYYLPFDLKFTSKLNTKPSDLGMYSSQIRLYAYMVGQLQGFIPPFGYLITRDELFSTVVIPTRSTIDNELDQDLIEIRDLYLEIKENGDQYRPWTHEIVYYNMKNTKDTPWHNAKKEIAHNRYDGGDPSDMYEINLNNRNELIEHGFPSIQAMLNVESSKIPLEELYRIGPAKATKIRAILNANRTGNPGHITSDKIPDNKEYEFYIDYEFFNNLNVNFEKQWPTLDGYEMVFMIGIGWMENDIWNYKAFIADEESQSAELKIVNEFIDFLDKKTDGSFQDNSKTTLFHWTSAEVWQTRHIYERHELPNEHPIRNLPWVDLQKSFYNGKICVPGAWEYGLKEIAQALNKYNDKFESQWPSDLYDGLQAMVMGWFAYTKDDVFNSDEMKLLIKYLEMDCKALFNILSWLRSEISK